MPMACCDVDVITREGINNASNISLLLDDFVGCLLSRARILVGNCRSRWTNILHGKTSAGLSVASARTSSGNLRTDIFHLVHDEIGQTFWRLFHATISKPFEVDRAHVRLVDAHIVL